MVQGIKQQIAKTHGLENAHQKAPTISTETHLIPEKIQLTAKKTKAKAKAFAASLVAPAPKKDLRRYYETFLTLLLPKPEGILGEVLPKIVNDKKLGPYFKDIMEELGCNDEKIIIDTSVQWLNTRPAKAGTLALLNKWPEDDTGLKNEVKQFTNNNSADLTQMENKFKEVLVDTGCNVYQKLYTASKNPIA